MDYARPDRADALAAQYVAGTLRGPVKRRFETLLPSHPALQRAVQAWQARLMPLTSVLAPVAPPPDTWTRIEQRLWPAAVAHRLPWWRGLAFWRMASGLATVATVGLGLLLANPPAQDPPVIVVLQGTEAGGPARTSVVASVSADGRMLVARPVQAVAMAAEQVLELWAVPPQGAPRSLGLIAANGATVIPRERLLTLRMDGRNTAALAVSIEPPGGSPTGVPTGPVVFAGKLQL
jgi:anti-sigma-K factor RskA